MSCRFHSQTHLLPIVLILATLQSVPAAHAGQEAKASERDSAKELSQPLSDKERQQLTERLQLALKSIPEPQPTDTNAVQVHSRRGDLLFFLGRFEESVTEYRQMVSINPDLDSSHWRLGIALFFANQAEAAAEQFEKYHSFDDVDRENGIWRYLCQYKAQGAEVARRELIRYQKDDREPFPAVYRLFDASMTIEQALGSIPDDLSAAERSKRLFYTELYIGMHLVVQKKPQDAIRHLGNAVSQSWPRGNGFGSDYMWHVGRLQYDMLVKNSEDADSAQSN